MPIFLTMLLCGIGLLFISLWLGHDHDFDHGDAEHHGLGLLNTKVIGAFLMAFGAVGALARYQGHAMLPSSAWGTVGGAAFERLSNAAPNLVFTLVTKAKEMGLDLTELLQKAGVGLDKDARP